MSAADEEIYYLPTHRVAAVLDVSVRSVLNAIRAGELDAIDVSGSSQSPLYRVASDSLERYLERRRVVPRDRAAG